MVQFGKAPAAQPWRCLCLGFSQITRTIPLRLIIRHFSQIFFTDARTFISRLLFYSSLLTIRNVASPTPVMIWALPFRPSSPDETTAQQAPPPLICGSIRSFRSNSVSLHYPTVKKTTLHSGAVFSASRCAAPVSIRALSQFFQLHPRRSPNPLPQPECPFPGSNLKGVRSGLGRLAFDCESSLHCHQRGPQFRPA
jgi:hypothetical protein